MTRPRQRASAATAPMPRTRQRRVRNNPIQSEIGKMSGPQQPWRHPVPAPNRRLPGLGCGSGHRKTPGPACLGPASPDWWPKPQGPGPCAPPRWPRPTRRRCRLSWRRSRSPRPSDRPQRPLRARRDLGPAGRVATAFPTATAPMRRHHRAANPRTPAGPRWHRRPQHPPRTAFDTSVNSVTGIFSCIRTAGWRAGRGGPPGPTDGASGSAVRRQSPRPAGPQTGKAGALRASQSGVVSGGDVGSINEDSTCRTP